eukprot:384931_1
MFMFTRVNNGSSVPEKTAKHLIELFPNLEPKWIKDLVSTFPDQDIEFLSSQCIEMGNQLQLLNENKEDNKEEEKQPPLIRNASLVLPIDDNLLIEETVTDEGPSMSLLTSLPKYLSDSFESFAKTISPDFIPGLLDILCHLELMKFNAIFMQHEFDQSNQHKLSECLTEIQTLLTDLSNNLQHSNYRTICRSKTSFKDKCLCIQGTDTLLAYIGWNFIETNEQDNGGIYMYPNNNNNEYLLSILKLFTIYINYINQPNQNEEKIDDDINNDNLNVPTISKQDSYVTPQGPKDEQLQEQNRITGLIENDMKYNEQSIALPYRLDVNRLLLFERISSHVQHNDIMDMSMMNMIEHEWHNSIPKHASITQKKRKNVNIYVYTWKSIDSHQWKYLAIEIEMNKFDRISLLVELTNCVYSNVSSDYKLDNVQIFKNENKINIITEIAPFDNKLVFKVKYDAYKGISYRTSYKYLKNHEQDIEEYIAKCDKYMRDITDKYLQLFQRYNLYKIVYDAEILNDILEKKMHVNYFIDLEFPPSINSLITKNTNKEKDTNKFENLVWRRLWDFTKSPTLFGDKPIQYSNVVQGGLGNCGFAATLSALAAHPELIKELFIFPSMDDNNLNQISEIGLYEIQICYNGIWKKYIMDDCIPCKCNRNFAFATHEYENVLWVSLIEKCVAKAYGGYDRLISFGKTN